MVTKQHFEDCFSESCLSIRLQIIVKLLSFVKRCQAVYMASDRLKLILKITTGVIFVDPRVINGVRQLRERKKD